MADGALRGTHRHFAISESRPEHVKQRVTLRLVPGARPGGVRVDVVHVVRGKAGVRQRRAHRARRAGAVRGRLRDVERVRALPEPPNLGVDLLCAARSRVLQTLNNQHTRALADHEPGTGRVERTARRRVRVFLFRVVVVVVRSAILSQPQGGFRVGERARPREARDGGRVHAALRPPGEHHVRLASLHGAERVAHGVRARRARGGGGSVRSAEVVRHAHLPRGGVAQDSRDEERRQLFFQLVSLEQASGVRHVRDVAHAAADAHAASIRVHGGGGFAGFGV
mmetsp:Transcript_13466/g.57428  ORF Transcript_13466/g.57428 Transcript_13466/m.57428 type:complete len:282 (+) Transcript_13466:1547-2392(+)